MKKIFLTGFALSALLLTGYTSTYKTGAIKTAQRRFQGKTKKEISERMKMVRAGVRWDEVQYTKKDASEMNTMAEQMVNNINKNVTE